MDLSESGETKVSNLEVHCIINKNILKFQVSVNDTFSVHVVEHVHHLG